MTKSKLYKSLRCIFALVWLINGLYCKILNFEPRHQEIVGRILGSEFSRYFTLIIGFLEVLMAIWIFVKILPELNAALQITVISAMNIIEFFLVPDLLLWGKLNILFAALFAALIYYNEFVLKKDMNNVIIS